MQPRTVADFAAHRLHVTLSCRSCGGVQVAPLDVLDATFGAYFDLVANSAGVSPACGEPRPAVLLDALPTASKERAAEPERRYG